jgi:hypothetical protein
LLQACNCKHWKPNKEKQFQSRIAEEQKTLDPFNKVRLLFLFTNLLLSLSFLGSLPFLNSQFLIGHRLAVLDSIIKIQNSLHLPSFFQQPQNHLKKQGNWYITRKRSALGLLSELCFRVEREGIHWLKEMVKGFSFSSLYVEEEKIGWRFSLLFEGKGGEKRWKRPIHLPDPTLLTWEESFDSLFPSSCEWWQHRRVHLLWDIFYWNFKRKIEFFETLKFRMSLDRWVDDNNVHRLVDIKDWTGQTTIYILYI